MFRLESCTTCSDFPGGVFRIIGGEAAVTYSWPHVVAIRNAPYPNGDLGDQFCGGSIIKNKWILTAAHCLYVLDGVVICTIKTLQIIARTHVT